MDRESVDDGLRQSSGATLVRAVVEGLRARQVAGCLAQSAGQIHARRPDAYRLSSQRTSRGGMLGGCKQSIELGPSVGVQVCNRALRRQPRVAPIAGARSA